MTNMDEAFLPEAEVADDRKSDWREVTNYIPVSYTHLTLPTSDLV